MDGPRILADAGPTQVGAALSMEACADGAHSWTLKRLNHGGSGISDYLGVAALSVEACADGAHSWILKRLMHGSQVLVGPETLASLGFIDRSIVIAVRQVKDRFLNAGSHRYVLELWALSAKTFIVDERFARSARRQALELSVVA